jgi:predicted Zn-ribbon and HTH transcriptional regulator
VDQYARAPDAIDLTKALHDAMAATYQAQPRHCNRCGTPFDEWDTVHPLYRAWSRKCPTCHVRDIQLDFAHQNQES